jgi:hypothetical protein
MHSAPRVQRASRARCRARADGHAAAVADGRGRRPPPPPLPDGTPPLPDGRPPLLPPPRCRRFRTERRRFRTERRRCPPTRTAHLAPCRLGVRAGSDRPLGNLGRSIHPSIEWRIASCMRVGPQQAASSSGRPRAGWPVPRGGSTCPSPRGDRAVLREGVMLGMAPHLGDATYRRRQS